MFSNLSQIQHLVKLMNAHGIKHIVLCPGSRNAPIVHNIVQSGLFECHSVTDERSAGFFAIGLYLSSGCPAAVCCTSGTALLNLHPAVCEAFYQQIPLLIVSADRPAAWIGQMDGQTLPQPGVFGQMVRKCVQLPEQNDEWFCNRLINEALLELEHHGKGPVHINVPLSEPLFGFIEETLKDVRVIRRWEPENGEDALKERLREDLKKHSRILVVSGQMNSRMADELNEYIPENIAWICEILGNNPKKALRMADVAIYAADEECISTLNPDMVISFGGHLVSKRIKNFLRKARPSAHWHITENGELTDTFCCLTQVVEMSALRFWKTICHEFSGCIGNGGMAADYYSLWQKRTQEISFTEPVFSSLYAVRQITEKLPPHTVLHLANSSAVRLAELCSLPELVAVECNRGTSGIEGSMSTAIGYAADRNENVTLNVFITGDLSFFYDMNAISVPELNGNIRIVVLNNSCGAIFHTIPGMPLNESGGQFITAKRTEGALSVKGWAESCGMAYYRCDDKKSLSGIIDEFIDINKKIPAILEVFTDEETDTRAFKGFFRENKLI